MDDNPDLRHLLDGPASIPPPDDFDAIVKRAGRRTLRIGAALGVVVLLAGGVGGYLLADGGSSPASVVATAGDSPNEPAAAPGAEASSSGGALAGVYRHDFTRTTDAAVTIRVFQPAQEPTDVEARVVEVSTSGMVGTTMMGQGEGTTAQPIAQVLGTLEGAPVLVVTSFTPATVTEARWTGVGGGDAMAPSGNFVALAVPVASAPANDAAIGTLTFTDAAGHVIETQQLKFDSEPAVCAGSSSGTTTTPVAAPTCGSVSCASSGAPASGQVCMASPPGSAVCTSLNNGETCSASASTSIPTTAPSLITPGIQTTPRTPATAG